MTVDDTDRLPKPLVGAIALGVLLVVAAVVAFWAFLIWWALAFIAAVRAGDTGMAAVLGGVAVGLMLAGSWLSWVRR